MANEQTTLSKKQQSFLRCVRRGSWWCEVGGMLIVAEEDDRSPPRVIDQDGKIATDWKIT